MLALLTALCATGCRQDMHNQPRYKPFATTDFFGDGRSERPSIEDTVARGQLHLNDARYTGYTVANDKGTSLTLRAGSGDDPNPSFYYSWKMPGDTGGDFYRDNIAGCNTSLVHWGDPVIQEPGNMVGPTVQGVQMLIDKDPNAIWDTNCKCVKNSAYGGTTSPRVFPIPLYDPAYYANGKLNGRDADFKVANFLGFFVDSLQGNSVFGYVTDVIGVVDSTAGPAPAASFPKAIRLVQ